MKPLRFYRKTIAYHWLHQWIMPAVTEQCRAASSLGVSGAIKRRTAIAPTSSVAPFFMSVQTQWKNGLNSIMPFRPARSTFPFWQNMQTLTRRRHDMSPLMPRSTTSGQSTSHAALQSSTGCGSCFSSTTDRAADGTMPDIGCLHPGCGSGSASSIYRRI